MNGGAPVLSAYGSALAAVGYLALAIRVVPRRSQWGDVQAAVPLTLFGAALASAAWASAGWLPALFDTTLDRLLDTADLIRYGLWFGFLLLLLRPHRRLRHQRRLRWYGAAAAALLLTAAFGRVFAGAFGRQAFPAVDSLGRFASMALAVFGLVLTEQLFRNATDESRWGIKPLCVGLACIFAFDLYLYSQASLFGEVDADASSIRGVVHALAVPLIFVASQRNSDWLGKLQLSRAVAFHSAALLLAGAYLLFISALGYYVRYFGGSWGGALQLGVLTAALVALAVTLMSGAMRAKLRVWLGKHFFSYRYDYRREWLRFTQTLSAASSPQDTGRLVIRGLADMLESPAGGLWSMARGDGAELVQTSRWNVPAIDGREPPDSPFATFLLHRGWIVDLDEYRQRPDRYGDLALPPWLLDQPQFWLVVPLIVADKLTGFVVLARARTPIDVNWEVTDLLKTASRQAASFLAQVDATEALLEVRKFDAFNRMSAFVVHDLKNIVTQLSLMMKNAERLRDNPEFHDDMMMTIDSSLEKMRRMMLQLREGEAPADGASGVALTPILRRIEAQARARGRVLDVTVVDRAATRGHADRIERVLGHVVQNAFDATPSGGRVWMRLQRTAGQATVEVGDTGQGMSAEFVQRRLFKPFQTTKVTGMGIGAYESFQYVKELGGSIDVASELERGTVVTISMPLLDMRESADLQRVDET